MIRLVRGRSEIGPNAVAWDPVTGQIDTEKFGDINAVIHLAGEGVGNGRWTAAKKRRILESRRLGTRLLAEMTAQMNPRPAAFLSASAIGRYGPCGDEILTEKSSSGSDFLADVCAEWESATQPASDAGIRVALLRIGVVLSPDGGALGNPGYCTTESKHLFNFVVERVGIAEECSREAVPNRQQVHPCPFEHARHVRFVGNAGGNFLSVAFHLLQVFDCQSRHVAPPSVTARSISPGMRTLLCPASRALAPQDLDL